MSTTEEVSRQREERIRALEAKIRLNGAKLSDYELSWRDKQAFLESRGYMLRPRYHPNWVPSWTESTKNPDLCEDFVPLPPRVNIIDATRTSDGKQVFVKRIAAQKEESSIAHIFSQEPLKSDPKNHCVPVLDIFADPVDDTVLYMVMPFLRHTDSPPLSTVNDIIELADQLFEGLLFMHAQGVAHRDCAYMNIMMDATVLYPRGFHPLRREFAPDLKSLAKVRLRYLAPEPVKYYFTDFGISTRFEPEETERLVVGEDGLDQEVPELSSEVPYDPFKVDIFILGNFFKQYVHQKFCNVEFLSPLVDSMTSHDPTARPDAQAVCERWHEVRSGVGFLQRGMPLEPRTNDKGANSESRYKIIFYRMPLILRHELHALKRRWFRPSS